MRAPACSPGLFFLAVFAMPRTGVLGLPRYDLLLLFALAVQAGMLWTKVETWDELRRSRCFMSRASRSKSSRRRRASGRGATRTLPTRKLFGVPLFSGFMYAAVGSYIIQAWRLFDLRIRHHPPYWMAADRATHLRQLLHASFRRRLPLVSGRLQSRPLRPYDRDLPSLGPRSQHAAAGRLRAHRLLRLAGGEHRTFFGIWSYPHQLGAWATVHLGKWNSWSLLVIMTFTIVASLKHIKAAIPIPD